ncbi:putative disease resistance protein At4g11170 [Neltuma alba]|uniref:putative disease resistance protein At4g11170 n=1 Tax=Neltuma alba TaxID=207710 RepID=UPI0010A4DB9C|nr:putative disease resistance protein At4g11170 [Prosopis alba]
MASSSSSAPSSQSSKKYDVFISFRGEDTRLNFTSHLYHALCGQKIYAYIDDSLEKGDEVWPSLEKAIKDSTLFLVVFSENYASSTWCLKELAKILECCRNQRHLLIPVFYRVDPSDVRKQRGSYHEAFEGHERKSSNNTQQLRQWREALTHAANLSGWHCSPDRNEAVLIEEIVNCIMKELDRRYQSEDHLKGLIGIHKKMAVVESMLDKGSKNGGCQFIGIWGMGGLGKTTLVRALYDKQHFEYEGSYFLEKVGEKLKKDGIDALRKELVWSLLGGKAIYSHIMTRLRRTKVFIVLDDVDNAEQLENLVGRCEFGSGSKVLITSRDKQVLRTKVDDNNIYALHGLDPYEAFQLFSLNAFKTGCSDPKIKELAEEVTKYAGGNPLALKVLGSILRGKNQEAWKSQLAKLQKLFCPEVIDILRLSFEGLDKEEKNIFLHVACFFNYYYDAEDVKKLLDTCSYSTEIGLTILEEKALLDIDRGRICMHSLIKQMGKQIVREESLNYPTWCNIFWIFKESSDILKKKMGRIEGMVISLSEVEETFCQKSHAMDWVGCPLESLPTTFKAESLVRLEMPYSRLTRLWDGVQPALFRLQYCQSLTSLTSDTPLQSLSRLDVSYCSSLEEFSVTSENEELCSHLSGAAIRGALRSSSGHRSKIRDLAIANCGNVTSDLRGVDAGGCNELASPLLSKCDKMGALERLGLPYCNELSELPNDIRLLSSLRHLHLSQTNVQTLPSSIKHLSLLQRLGLEGCKRLRCLPELPPSVLQLFAMDCISLETIQYSPLTNEGEEGKDKACPRFLFTNCKKLNRRAIEAAEARVLLAIKKATYDDAILEYPGKIVPKWFKFKSTEEDPMTVNLSSIPNSEDGGFLFCVVVSKLPSGGEKLMPNGLLMVNMLAGPLKARFTCMGSPQSMLVFGMILIHLEN